MKNKLHNCVTGLSRLSVRSHYSAIPFISSLFHRYLVAFIGCLGSLGNWENMMNFAKEHSTIVPVKNPSEHSNAASG